MVAAIRIREVAVKWNTKCTSKIGHSFGTSIAGCIEEVTRCIQVIGDSGSTVQVN